MYKSWKSLTDRVLDRDRGVCLICETDCIEAKRKYDDLCLQFGRSIVREATRDQIGYLPPDGRFWEVDHIIPVSLGGGGCGLDNLRTLCWVCHKEVTADLKRQLAKMPRKVREQKINRFSCTL
ncbi:MAG: HNH endonuclease signature motif containing protein [Nitrospirales bacterium]|nr:HNH endonuclease [Nitrospirales bacterium]